ncbi:MAG: hypothetical protein ABI151_04225 [Chitinophagaceae bacterium]
MKYTFLCALICMIACRQQSPVIPHVIVPFTAIVFEQVKNRLDFSTITKFTGKENQEVWLVQFKGDTNSIYAASAKSELLYERRFTNTNSGYIDITRGDETIRMSFKNGTRTISAMSTSEHGGTGFCQREQGERFKECFVKESDEFCDSFASCVALATQPAVSVLIGMACSCNAK